MVTAINSSPQAQWLPSRVHWCVRSILPLLCPRHSTVVASVCLWEVIQCREWRRRSSEQHTPPPLLDACSPLCSWHMSTNDPLPSSPITPLPLLLPSIPLHPYSSSISINSRPLFHPIALPPPEPKFINMMKGCYQTCSNVQGQVGVCWLWGDRNISSIMMN